MANVSVKVFYIENKTTKEIRKFSVDSEVAESYEYLAGKIRQIFPGLMRKDINLFWKDEEGDFISVSSDDELRLAFDAIQPYQNGLKIFVKVKDSEKTNATVHPGITCDGCDSKINGIRYKCTSCYDYDLCGSCEAKGQHPEDHELLCIKRPRSHGSIYVVRSPFGRCQRGRTPWSGRGTCDAKKRNPCAGKQEKCETNKENFEKEKSSDQQTKGEQNPIEEMIRHFSSAFGFDPDVAISQVKDVAAETGCVEAACFDDIATQFSQVFGVDPEHLKNTAKAFVNPKEEKTQENGTEEGNKTTEETQDKETVNMSESIADDDDVVVTKDEVRKQKEESKESMETDQLEEEASKNKESEPTQEKQPNFESMLDEVAKQFGFVPQQQGEEKEGNHPSYGTLGDIMKSVFENFNKQQDGNLEQDKVESDQKKEDFVVVGSSPVPENLSREQDYERRLEKAIKQMEAMGFDNENDWLKQLLISKDLSIGKVLDALNPPSIK